MSFIFLFLEFSGRNCIYKKVDNLFPLPRNHSISFIYIFLILCLGQEFSLAIDKYFIIRKGVVN